MAGGLLQLDGESLRLDTRGVGASASARGEMETRRLATTYLRVDVHTGLLVLEALLCKASSSPLEVTLTSG